jgi:hypothetical protein
MGSHNVADDEIKAIFADVGAGQGPPLGIDAHDIIERGAKIRRRRKRLAVLGTSATTAAAIVAIALASGQHTGGPVPVQPAGPGISLETVPDTPSPGSLTTPRPGATRAPRPSADPRVSTRSNIVVTPRPGAPTTNAPSPPCSPRPPPGQLALTRPGQVGV